MLYLVLFLSVVSLLISLYLYFQLVREKKRNRILQSFMAGVVRSVSDYYSKTDAISPEDIPLRDNKFPISYKKILDNIQYEFGKDFLVEPYQKRLKEDRLLFNDDKYGNDGFNFMYWDFFDTLYKQWHEK